VRGLNDDDDDDDDFLALFPFKRKIKYNLHDSPRNEMYLIFV